MIHVAGPLRVAAALLLAACWSGLLLLTIAVQRLRKGADVLRLRSRPRPALLDDPQLGTHRFVTVGGIKLHYVEKGDKSKPLLVLVHGFPAFWYCWHYQIKDLAKDYWVVAVDLRGYGQSDKPAGRQHYAQDLIAEDLLGLVKALGRSSCVLVAHDWGGIIAFRAAALQPAVVDKLVIINAPHPQEFEWLLSQSWDQLRRSWYVCMFQLPWLPETVISMDDLDLLEKMFRANPAMKHHFPAAMIDAYKYTFGQPNALTPPLEYYRQNFGLSWGRRERAEVEPITCPLLMVWGEKDRALSPLLATMPARIADRFTVRCLPHASHWSMMEFPDEVNGFIREFVERE